MPGVSKGVRRGLPLLHCTDTLVADVEDVEVPRSTGGEVDFRPRTVHDLSLWRGMDRARERERDLYGVGLSKKKWKGSNWYTRGIFRNIFAC